MRHRLRGGLALGLVSGLAAGCYTSRPLTAVPAPDTHLTVVLNDQGRVGVGSQVGPSAAQIEGTLVQATDTGYVLEVSAVEGISGARQRWAGEVVNLRTDYVASVRERRLSPVRTALAVIGFAGSAIVFIASQGLGVLGGGDDPSGPPGDGGDDK